MTPSDSEVEKLASHLMRLGAEKHEASRPIDKPITAAKLLGACEAATFLGFGITEHHCLVRFNIAKDAARRLRFAIYIWTIPAQFVHIYLAISATEASGQHTERR